MPDDCRNGENSDRPKFLTTDYEAENKKALEILARFQASHYTVYAKKPGHKRYHPTAPSRGVYNCNLLYQERYLDEETAKYVASKMEELNPGWAFQVRRI